MGGQGDGEVQQSLGVAAQDQLLGPVIEVGGVDASALHRGAIERRIGPEQHPLGAGFADGPLDQAGRDEWLGYALADVRSSQIRLQKKYLMPRSTTGELFVREFIQ